jgi:hypothetical protein
MTIESVSLLAAGTMASDTITAAGQTNELVHVVVHGSHTWIEWVRDILASFALGFALWRIFLMRETFFSDHDRSRRTKAVDLIQFWSSNLTLRASLARRIAESLEEQQCRDLSEQKPFDIPSSKEDLLRMYLREVTPSKETEKSADTILKLDEGQVSVLRWDVVSYLNQLEAILSAWRHNIASRDILEEEFDYLYDASKGMTMIEKFRIASGIDSYPAIKEFVEHVKSAKQNKGDKGKGKGPIANG